MIFVKLTPMVLIFHPPDRTVPIETRTAMLLIMLLVPFDGKLRGGRCRGGKIFSDHLVASGPKNLCSDV